MCVCACSLRIRAHPPAASPPFFFLLPLRHVLPPLKLPLEGEDNEEEEGHNETDESEENPSSSSSAPPPGPVGEVSADDAQL